jgi:hypothetical protein
MSNLQDAVKKDDNFKTYRSILNSVRGALDLVKTKREAEVLHANRKCRKLFEMRLSPQLLHEALLDDLAARSRLVELKSLVINQVELLDSAISLCKKHIAVQYADKVSEIASTVAARNQVVERMFSKGKDYLNQVRVLDSQLDLYITDIDKASYNLTGVRETLKMILDKKESI